MWWFLLWPLSLVFTMLAFLLAPVLPLFATNGWLPWQLSYFQTPDNPLDGDEGFKTQHAPFLGMQTGWRQYVNRIFWLWRNPAYGADFSLFGFTPTGGWSVACSGDSAVDDTHDGWYFKSCQGAWQFYLTHHWTATCYLRINLGWKLWALPSVCQIVLAVNPWKQN